MPRQLHSDQGKNFRVQINYRALRACKHSEIKNNFISDEHVERLIRTVLGPLLFTAYVSPVGELIESHGVSYHQFADDTQLLVSMDSSDAAPAIDRLARCSAADRKSVV